MDASRDVDPDVLFKKQCPYKVLDRCIRDIYKMVVPVHVTGTHDELKIENSIPPETEPKKKTSDENVSIKVIISTSSGMELSRDGLDYRSLKTFIERLEGLLC